MVGINSCNGCPTIIGEAIIIPKIKSLIHYGATHVHLTYCLLKLCPFKNKYIKTIKDNFPKINLILGSHEPHQTDKELKCEIVNMLTERKKCMIP